MYERAAAADDVLKPVWHVEGGHTFFAGPLAYNASHAHGAPVYLAGLYGDFRIRMSGQTWTTCRTAFVPAGVAHELDLRGDPLGVFYREPDAAGPAALAALVCDASEIGGALVGRRGEIGALRELYETRSARDFAGSALADLSAFSGRRAGRPLDARIGRILAYLSERQDRGMSADRLAASVGLSASRMQHLFTETVGVPFRRYRAWARMRRAIAAVVEGGSFTQAAHEAGFADQPHFANDFRKTFGAPASKSLLHIRR